jgi:hypothetical protein
MYVCVGGIDAAHVFSFLSCGICFVCLHPVSCVPNVARVSGLSNVDCPFGFLKRLFSLKLWNFTVSVCVLFYIFCKSQI